MYFLAILTTNRRLASANSRFAFFSLIRPRAIERTVVRRNSFFVSIFGSDHPWSWEDPTEYKRNDLQMKEITLERGYVNLYPFGIGGDWHTDSDSKNGRTILFYPSDWKEEYGGATEFKSGEKVEYKKNRLLVFDGTKPHRAVIHNNPKNRYTIAFKINIGYK